MRHTLVMEKLSTRLTSVRERKEIDFHFNWLENVN
jgi:hypothetical protein